MKLPCTMYKAIGQTKPPKAPEQNPCRMKGVVDEPAWKKRMAGMTEKLMETPKNLSECEQEPCAMKFPTIWDTLSRNVSR